jgi:hypothetical protein
VEELTHVAGRRASARTASACDLYALRDHEHLLGRDPVSKVSEPAACLASVREGDHDASPVEDHPARGEGVVGGVLGAGGISEGFRNFDRNN